MKAGIMFYRLIGRYFGLIMILHLTWQVVMRIKASPFGCSLVSFHRWFLQCTGLCR